MNCWVYAWKLCQRSRSAVRKKIFCNKYFRGYFRVQSYWHTYIVASLPLTSECVIVSCFLLIPNDIYNEYTFYIDNLLFLRGVLFIKRKHKYCLRLLNERSVCGVNQIITWKGTFIVVITRINFSFIFLFKIFHSCKVVLFWQ